MTELWTTSRIRAARSCLRLHHYRYELALQSPPTPRMRFGTVAHHALEAWYRAWSAGDVDGRLAAAMAQIDQLPDAEDRARLRVMIAAYDARWGSARWRVLDVEVEFRFMLDDELIGGKIDAIVEDVDTGRIFVVEHKTTSSDSSIGAPYWDRLAIDTQVSVYVDGASMLGYDVAGCIYDVLKRPDHERRMATPASIRSYTKGRGCKGCGGSGGGKAGIVRGRGYYIVAGLGSVVTENQCLDCKGTGWLCDADGVPQAPRLHANQRDTDETIEEFEDRITASVVADPDKYLIRGNVVRLDSEMPAMRQDLLDTIALVQIGKRTRNPDACVRGHNVCPFFDACAGRASIDTFTRGRAHPELAA